MEAAREVCSRALQCLNTCAQQLGTKGSTGNDSVEEVPAPARSRPKQRKSKARATRLGATRSKVSSDDADWDDDWENF